MGDSGLRPIEDLVMEFELLEAQIVEAREAGRPLSSEQEGAWDEAARQLNLWLAKFQPAWAVVERVSRSG